MNNATPAPTLRQKLFVIRTIAFALSTGIMMFLGVTLFLGRESQGEPSSSLVTFTGISASLWVGGFIAGFVLYRILTSPRTLAPRVAGLEDDTALHALIPQVQVACLVRWALLEGPALFACITVFLNKHALNTNSLLPLNVAIAIASAALIMVTVPREHTVREMLRCARKVRR